MPKIKLCGLSRPIDIETANRLEPDYIGFIFARKSKRYVDPQEAARLRALLSPHIQAVGVFVNEDPTMIASLLNQGIIDVAQLHGQETNDDILKLRSMTTCPIFKAFRIDSPSDVERANQSTADMVLLDSGNGGTGTSFDWTLLKGIRRDFFLAGGLDPSNVADAIAALHPYGVDVSSGIETDGKKDIQKMEAFVKEASK